MTRQEIHIKAVLRKKGYIYDATRKCFDKYKWKSVENGKKQTYLHVIIRVNATKQTFTATFFTDITFSSIYELEKYYVVYNRVIADLQELGIKYEECVSSKEKTTVR